MKPAAVKRARTIECTFSHLRIAAVQRLPLEGKLFPTAEFVSHALGPSPFVHLQRRLETVDVKRHRQQRLRRDNVLASVYTCLPLPLVLVLLLLLLPSDLSVLAWGEIGRADPFDDA